MARTGRLWQLAPPTMVAALAGLAAFPSAFFGRAVYDDEGIMIAGFRSFASQGHLYGRTYANYGPFPYALWWSLLRPFGYDYADLTVGRALALVLLALSCACAFVTIRRVTHSFAWSALAAVVVWRDLHVDFNEPWHPGALIGLLLLGLALTLTFRPTRTTGAVQGVLIAALVLTKVNVGAFALGAFLAVQLAALCRRAGAPRWARWAVPAVLFVAPLVVCSADLSELGTLTLALAVGLTAVAATWVAGDAPAPSLRWRPIVAAMAATASAASAVVVLRGARPSDVLPGMLTRALHQRTAFFLGFSRPGAVATLAFLSAVFVAVVLRSRAARRRPGLHGALLLVAGCVLVAFAPRSLRIGLVPLAALFALPGSTPTAPHDAAPTTRAALSLESGSLLLVLLAVFQTLHAYPVAGSQLGWALLLTDVVGVAVAARGAALLLGDVPGAPGADPRRARLVALTVLSGLTLLVASVTAPLGAWRDYRAGTPIDALHARLVRLPGDQAATLRRLAGVLEEHCPSFVGLPGFGSLYVFSGTAPPTGRLATAWPWLFSDAEQRRALQDIRDVPDLCVVRNAEVLQFWQQGKPAPRGPLVAELARFTELVATVDGYDVTRLPGGGGRPHGR